MRADILIEPEPEVIETENPPQLTEIDNNDYIQFDESLNTDRRIRTVVYNKLLAAAQTLPDNHILVVYEAYRARDKQIAMWNDLWSQLRESYPDDTDETIDLRCNRYIANPFKHGSGHQYGCSVDVSIRNIDTGQDLDMGCGLQEFNDKTATTCEGLNEPQSANRQLLLRILKDQGMVNYPPEWWHFSYGDRQWAIQTDRDQTLYAALPF